MFASSASLPAQCIRVLHLVFRLKFSRRDENAKASGLSNSMKINHFSCEEFKRTFGERIDAWEVKNIMYIRGPVTEYHTR